MKVKSAKVILASALGMSLSVPAFATDLKDTNIPWAQSAIQKFIASGAITGYPDHTFKPNNPINRAEFTTIVNKAFEKYDSAASANFSDVKSNQWFYKQVASAKEAGYVTGYPNNSFLPGKSINRAEAAVMVAKLLHIDTSTSTGSTFKDNELPKWASASINALADKKILNGYTDGYFRPANYISRAEAVVLLNNALSFLEQGNTTPTEPVTVGLKGTVTQDGKTVGGADLKAFKTGDYVLQKDLTSDAKGNFNVDLAAGSYYVTATKDKQVGYASNITLTKDNGAVVSIKLQAGVNVSGKLLDANGYPLKNTTYAFTVEGASFTGVTDGNGSYQMLLPMNKTYSLSALNPTNVSSGLRTINNAVGIKNTDTTLSDMKAPFTVVSTGGGGGGGGGPYTNAKPFTDGQTVTASDLQGVTEADITGTVTLNGNLPSGVTFVLKSGATLQAKSGTTAVIPGNVTMDQNSTLSGITVQGTTTIQ
jgi:hypothetical protein